ncbi:TetR/AcrR family transcriptional regulator [Paenibacillus hemerocallicola]|jgi:AcrR family transcriptional regulator|uniref:TetR/AcrR family transcriptional regulator n=1 Tax=Paenibacillus hemerocallicola TaxID=1172614 RepID=A0A5C4SYL0_9BACL|nr:TetR/AcrR family transcriptional regulator [Paenibacillus hemerocallicola]TNJ59087.1 TetR/AcrR family transcriptional regulator [Paenibacillus hemerocallicola]
MSIFKKKIMASAERLFTEKGYEATSIQDIADDCSIAKGSMYKFFPSKEDLYIEILEDRHQTMIEETDRIHDNASLSPREQFVEEIAYQLGYFMSHGFFVTNSRRELPPQTNDRISPHIFRMRARLLNYNRLLLIRQYGEALEPYGWDAVIILNAIAKEYLYLITAKSKPLSVRELAVYIAERMDDLVAGMLARGSCPMLTRDQMTEYAVDEPETVRQSMERCKGMVFERVASTIRELSVPNVRKRELEQVLELLKEEAQQEEPRRFLLHALLNDLGAEHELMPYASQMRMWVEKLLPV